MFVVLFVLVVVLAAVVRTAMVRRSDRLAIERRLDFYLMSKISVLVFVCFVCAQPALAYEPEDVELPKVPCVIEACWGYPIGDCEPIATMDKGADMALLQATGHSTDDLWLSVYASDGDYHLYKEWPLVEIKAEGDLEIVPIMRPVW